MSLAEDRSEPHRLKDPELRIEYELLESDEDRQDFLVTTEAALSWKRTSRRFMALGRPQCS
jgi:hypothetical protein